MSVDSEAQAVLLRHRRVWDEKRVLRHIYNQEFFARLLAHKQPGGTSIEVGGGPGFFKQILRDVISTDIIWCPWLDAVADAQSLPFKTSSIRNIFGLDMLHHLAAPMDFLHEAERILSVGGRLILVEPWITPFSYFIYRHFHQEDCDLSATPFAPNGANKARQKKAFEGNQAVPYLLFGPDGRERTLAALPSLRAVVLEPFCVFAYLLSFGFKPMNLLPEAFYPAVSKFERVTLPLWKKAAALRVVLVLEKSAQV